MVASFPSPRCPFVPLIAVFLIGLLLAPLMPAAALAQGDSQVVVGSSTITYDSSYWESASVFRGRATFISTGSGPRAMFEFDEFEDGYAPAADNAQLIQVGAIEVLEQVEYMTNFQLVGSGILADGTLWHYYTLLLYQEPARMLVAANMQVWPGYDVISWLMGPASSYEKSFIAARDGIAVNGQPHPIATITWDEVIALETGSSGPLPDTEARAATSHATGTGQTISWSAPWALAADRTLVTSAYDVIFLTDGSAWVVIATGNLAPDAARALLLGSLGGNRNGLVSLDEGGDGATSYWFEQVPLNGVSHGVFTVAGISADGSSATMAMYISSIPTFAAGMAQAQASVAIDGTTVFEGIAPAGLQAQLGPGVADTTKAGPTIAPSAAFVPAGSWTDPAYGYTLEWAAGWQLVGVRDTNTVMIETVDGNAGVHLSAMPREGTTPEYWAARFLTNPGFAEAGVQPETPVINAGNVFLVARGPGIVMVSEMLFLDDGATIVLATFAIFDPANTEPAVEQYRATVRIGGKVPLEGWVTTTPPAAAGQSVVPATSDPAEAFPDLEYADPGVVATGYYISPQHATNITWTNEWKLDRGAGVPVVTNPANGDDRLHLILAVDESAWITIEMFSHTNSGYPTISMFIFDATSEAFVDDIYGPTAEVVMQQVSGDTASMLVRFEEAGTVYWFVVEILPIAGGAGVAVIEYGTWAPLGATAYLARRDAGDDGAAPTSEVAAAVTAGA